MTLPRYLIQPGILAFFVEKTVDTAFHQHYALQLSLTAKGQANVWTEEGDNPVSCSGKALLIARNVPHRFSGTDCLVVFLEPESHIARNITRTWLIEQSCKSLDEQLPVEFIKPIIEVLHFSTLAAALGQIADVDCVSRHIDGRVEEVLQFFDRQIAGGLWKPLELKQAAALTHLSESRFLHLFSQQVGIPWRRYQLWRKLLLAAKLAVDGKSLTMAAVNAGFSDAAHFSRTFKDMFGVNPSSVFY